MSVAPWFGGLTVAFVASMLAACAGQPAPTSLPLPPVPAPEVLDKQPHAPHSDDRAWAAWAQTQASLERLWSPFQLEDAPPQLQDGEAILLVATGESGSCPMTVDHVEVGTGTVQLSAVDYPETPVQASFASSSGALEPVSTSDFNPITFVIAVEAGKTPPALKVFLGEMSIVLDEPATVAQVPFHPSMESD